MKLRLILSLVLLPVFVVSYLTYFVNSTFVNAQMENVFESQHQLLNAAHYYLTKVGPNEFEEQAKSLFQQEGLNSLVFVDPTGKVKMANESAMIGKSIGAIIGDQAMMTLLQQNAQEGSMLGIGSAKDKLLLTYAKLDFGEQRFVMLLSKPRSTATRAANLFLIKAILSVVALFFVLLFVSQYERKAS